MRRMLRQSRKDKPGLRREVLGHAKWTSLPRHENLRNRGRPACKNGMFLALGSCRRLQRSERGSKSRGDEGATLSRISRFRLEPRSLSPATDQGAARWASNSPRNTSSFASGSTLHWWYSSMPSIRLVPRPWLMAWARTASTSPLSIPVTYITC
jgi:hypothetical protein